MFVLFFLCWYHQVGVFGESVSVMEGDSVTLNTDVTEIREDNNVVWNFGAEKSLIAKTRKKFSTSDDVLDERFRDRLKLDNQTGSLTITNITTEHAGVYEVQITAAKLISKIFSVSVYACLSVPVISSNFSNCSSSSSSSSSQQNCSLLCSVVNVGHVTLSWYKGNSLLSSISVSDLSISLSLPLEVEYQDNNTYSCVLNNSFINQTQHLDISQLCQPCPVPPVSVSVSLISLISAGSLLIVAVVVIFWLCRKHRKTDQEVEATAEEVIYTEPTFNRANTEESNVKEESYVEYAPITMRKHRKTDQEVETSAEELSYTEPTFNRANTEESKAKEESVDYAPIMLR
ncbi:hypothetical protein G5714_021249 [Onychostoma macrolepis]|uniref:Ig-like domain-containing protein n=1 Tax=Onychostoma macrolepis TaxID=369639 RepID=A0A7J6BR97_9TELE|nr:hypothetical protein G5714_021249 [Onychostoma macrolepis]